MEDHIARPPTPQAMVHRLPDKPEASPEETRPKPSKFIILIAASNAVAGKVQIAKSVSGALECPLFQGDSLHETAAKAAHVGASSEVDVNKARYQRMWLSKMTRTGLLFPEESRAAGAGFSGFGGGGASSSASGSSSRRVSRAASDASEGSSSETSDATGASASTRATSLASGAGWKLSSVEKSSATFAHASHEEQRRQANPALMVLTHSELEPWHRDCIRAAVSDYGIGVVFVPLDDDAEPPVLKPFDPRTMTSFGPFESRFGGGAVARRWDEEVITLSVDVDATNEDLVVEIVDGVRNILYS